MLKVSRESQIYIFLSPIDMRNYAEYLIMRSDHS